MTVRILTLAAVVAAVVAPTAGAHGSPPLKSSERVDLDIYDAYLSQQCGVDVVATLSGTQRRKVHRGRRPASPARELTTFDGKITWLVEATGKSYTDRMRSALHISYPEGIELFKPARVVVTGTHGGTFPIGGGPAGSGILVYEATIYAEDQGLPFWFVDGDPVLQHGDFARTAKRICARLT